MTYRRACLWQPLAVVAEAARAARGRPVSTLFTALLVAGLVAGVLGLVGDSVAAEERVLARIDAAGTRTILLRAQRDQPLPLSLLASLSAAREVEVAIGFGPVVDARASAIGGGPPVGVRDMYGAEATGLIRTDDLAALGETGGVATVNAARAAGLRDGVGALVSPDGQTVEVVGTVDLPEHLSFLGPVVLVPRAPEPGESGDVRPLTLVAIVTTEPWQVRGVEALARRLASDSGADRATVETSAVLAEVRASVSGELSSYRRLVVLAALGLGAALVCVAVLGTTLQQRREYGRRRALGASRSLVVCLIVAQVGLPAVLGSIAGAGASVAQTVMAGRPLPSPSFVVALATAVVGAVLLAATIPALIASRRDPLVELRVP